MTRRRGCTAGLVVLAIAALLCGAAGLISALANRNLPIAPPAVEQLAAVDKARLAEALHLQSALGNAVWPGFGDTDIPVIVWNRETSFLVGLDEAPAGWQPVPLDTFLGQPYYRQPTQNPQNFAVPVDGRQAASIATKSETDAFLIEQFRQVLPPFLNAVFPYRLIIQPSEVQISAVLHEGFHVFQIEHARRQLEAAEEINALEGEYWRVDTAHEGAWKEEISLLREALNAPTTDDARSWAQRFVEQRQARRATQDLPDRLLQFERLIEWEEGLAKYVELKSWQLAGETPDYQPLPELTVDPDFKEYTSFEQRWSQELSTMRRQANQEGVTRFYYTGAAQAFLLDRLSPDWKVRAMAPGVALEDLVADAVDAMSTGQIRQGEPCATTL